MKHIQLLILFLIACALVSGYIVMNKKATTDRIAVDSAPFEVPTDIAPEGAFSSCVEKLEGDTCTFIINNRENDGVCQNIMGTLTCGPTFPDGSY